MALQLMKHIVCSLKLQETFSQPIVTGYLYPSMNHPGSVSLLPTQSNRSGHAIQYCLFDVNYHKGNKVTHLPLSERKELLETLVDNDQQIVKVQWMFGNGEAYFELVKLHGLEGIVQKSASSTYQINKRSHDWLKVINYQYTDAFITGTRKDKFGLLLSVEENGGLKSGGIMESPDKRI
jgi:DNA ligase 1